MCEIWLTLTIIPPERSCSGVFIVKFEHTSLFSIASVVNFEHVIVCWE